MEHTLQRNWTNTLKKTSGVLLKHPKAYHRLLILTLTDEITELEARLRKNANFNHHRNRNLCDSEKLTAEYNKRKENKLSRLIGNRKNRTRRRKTKKKTNKMMTSRAWLLTSLMLLFQKTRDFIILWSLFLPLAFEDREVLFDR